MLPKGDRNFSKLFKVWPVLDCFQKISSHTPEEKHSNDEQIIPTKCRSRMRQYFPKKTKQMGNKSLGTMRLEWDCL